MFTTRGSPRSHESRPDRRGDAPIRAICVARWRANDRRAARAVRRVDRGLLEFVGQAFLDLGFERAEARVRASLLFSAGVANAYLPWSIARSDVERLLAVVTAPAAARGPVGAAGATRGRARRRFTRAR